MFVVMAYCHVLYVHFAIIMQVRNFSVVQRLLPEHFNVVANFHLWHSSIYDSAPFAFWWLYGERLDGGRNGGGEKC